MLLMTLTISIKPLTRLDQLSMKWTEYFRQKGTRDFLMTWEIVVKSCRELENLILALGNNSTIILTFHTKDYHPFVREICNIVSIP